MRLLIASNNKGKIREYKEILEPLGFELISLDEAGIVSDPEETGTSFAENCFIKAKAAHELTGLSVLADDSGLCVDALDGEPGVFSARYGGKDTAKERSQLVLDKLGKLPAEQRTARFVCSIGILFSDGRWLEARGEVEGTIGFGFAGNNGFGYDPIFMYGSRSFAQLTAEEKNSVSHRANALKDLIKKLKELDDIC